MTASTVVSSKGQMVIPAKLRVKLGIKPGTRMDLSVEDGKLIGRVKNFEEVLALCGKYAGSLLEEDLAESRREWDERLERM